MTASDSESPPAEVTPPVTDNEKDTAEKLDKAQTDAAEERKKGGYQ